MSIKVAGILTEVSTKPLHTLLDAIGLRSSFLTMSGIAVGYSRYDFTVELSNQKI